MTDWRKLLETEFGEDIFDSGFKGEVVSSGSFIIDALTGIGGLPLGSIVEVFGPEGSGKTTLGLEAIKCAMDEKRPVLFEDYEHKVSNVQLKNVGIDSGKFRKDVHVSPKSLEDGWMIIKRFCENFSNGLIVVDSLAAMPPIKDVKKMNEIIGSVQIASMASVMSVALKQMTNVLYKSKNCLLFINQERAKISGGIGGMKTTPGGFAVKFYAAIRLQIQERGSIKTSKENTLSGKREDKITMLEISAKVIKNNFAPSYVKGRYYLRMNEGIDNLMSGIKLAEYFGWIRKGRGGVYTLDEKYSGDDAEGHKERGEERLRAYFKREEKIGKMLLSDVKKELFKRLKKEDKDE